MAHSAIPRNGHPQVGRHDGDALLMRTLALGRQLRPSLRIHIRIRALLRALAIRHLRLIQRRSRSGRIHGGQQQQQQQREFRGGLRTEAESDFDLDLSAVVALRLRGFARLVLRDADSRLRNLQVLQLHPHHKGFLRRSEYRSQSRTKFEMKGSLC